MVFTQLRKAPPPQVIMQTVDYQVKKRLRGFQPNSNIFAAKFGNEKMRSDFTHFTYYVCIVGLLILSLTTRP